MGLSLSFSKPQSQTSGSSHVSTITNWAYWSHIITFKNVNASTLDVFSLHSTLYSKTSKSHTTDKQTDSNADGWRDSMGKTGKQTEKMKGMQVYEMARG